MGAFNVRHRRRWRESRACRLELSNRLNVCEWCEACRENGVQIPCGRIIVKEEILDYLEKPEVFFHSTQYNAQGNGGYTVHLARRS